MNQDVRRGWGKRVAAARKAAGLRQVDLAERLGVSQNFISDVERGNCAPSDPNKGRFAEELGVAVGDLFPWPEGTAA